MTKKERQALKDLSCAIDLATRNSVLVSDEDMARFFKASCASLTNVINELLNDSYDRRKK